ncbi:MAG: zinc ribbon domain-containing protein [Ruminococcus sp.]|nr:zinc ribbon domain-containing protein [Ruminococcus sp.]
MSILDKFNDAQRVVAEKSKTAAETNNLKRKILYEEERIVEIFADIGKKYYKNPNEDPESFKILCNDIDTRKRRIKRMKYELISIRGSKICPKCNCEVEQNNKFCGRCGAPLPETEEVDFSFMEPEDAEPYSKVATIEEIAKFKKK